MKKTLIIGIIIILAIIAWWLWRSQALKTAPASDTTSAINQDLQSLNIDDLDKEFQSIDADLGTL